MPKICRKSMDQARLNVPWSFERRVINVTAPMDRSRIPHGPLRFHHSCERNQANTPPFVPPFLRLTAVPLTSPPQNTEPEGLVLSSRVVVYQKNTSSLAGDSHPCVMVRAQRVYKAIYTENIGLIQKGWIRIKVLSAPIPRVPFSYIASIQLFRSLLRAEAEAVIIAIDIEYAHQHLIAH